MGLLEKAVSTISPPDRAIYDKALARCDSLIKPPGSLGILEDIAARMAAISSKPRPGVGKKAVVVFAADHGVAAEGVSAFPKEVTRQMVQNFLDGGAAVNVLARRVGADVFAVDVGVDFDFPVRSGVISKKVSKGTRNFARGAAMTRAQAVMSVEAGIGTAFELAEKGYSLAVPGDMGIANTTSASAVMCACLGLSPTDIVGSGTGVDSAGLKKKTAVVSAALKKHFPSRAKDPIDILRKVGGYEIGAIAGMTIGLAARRIPVVVDGFVATAGTVLARTIAPAVADYLFFSHKSAEKGHAGVLKALGVKAPMDFGMCLGEGTGGLIMISVIEAALDLFNRMATFEKGKVSGASH
ncbi:nicotinate-nucleotide--dimethylbenzimidazole phosphoribosyltransferase [Candidatus Mycalebacterium sp.]